MRVIGYDENKAMFDVNLAVDEIVANEIDMWRLDLFDPNPVSYKVGERWLNFRRLRNIAFAYRTDDETVVAVHDGQKAVGMRSETNREPFRKWLRLRNAVPSGLTFWQHLHWYLTKAAHYETCWVTDYPNYPDELFPPLPSDRVRLRGRDLEFEVFINGDRLTIAPNELPCILEAPLFMGEMLTERRLQSDLPDSINWVFNHLGPFVPFIKGKGLREAMVGGKPEVIDIWVSRDTARALKQALATMSGVTIEQEILDGCEFRTAHGSYHVITPDSPTEILDLYRRPNTLDRGHSSADGLYCVRPNEVRGTRIAFFDAGHGQGRAVGRGQFLQMRSGKEFGKRHEIAWAAEGLKVVQPIRSLIAA